MTCGYCQHFPESTKRYESGERICKEVSTLTKQLLVTSNQEACKSFKLDHLFYCKRNNYQLDYNCCRNRRQKEVEGCVTCSQGKLIMGYIDSTNWKGDAE